MTQLATRPPRSSYAPADIERGLLALALAGGNTSKAARETKIPQRTLHAWRTTHNQRYETICTEQAPIIERAITQAARTYILEAAEAEAEALQAARDSIRKGHKDPATVLRNISLSKAVNVDKLLQLEGRPTTIVQHRSADEIIRRLQALGVIEADAEEIPEATVSATDG